MGEHTKKNMEEFLKHNYDVMGYEPEEMKGINPDVMVYRLNIRKGVKPLNKRRGVLLPRGRR